MGEGRKYGLRVDFNGSLRLEFHGATISSDAGLLAYRELDDASGLTEIADSLTFTMCDTARTRSIRWGRNSGNGCSVGLTDTKTQTTQSDFRLSGHAAVVGGRAIDHAAASTSQVGRFETEILTLPENRTALMNLSGNGSTGSGSGRR